MEEGMKTVSIKGNTLKLIAVAAMITDHIGASILQLLMAENGTLGVVYAGIQEIVKLEGTERSMAVCWWVMRMIIGRIAFPIYCFLLVEGFLHTRSVVKYGARMFVLALISEIPFDLALFQNWYVPYRQNVFFTLLLGLAGMWGIAAINRFCMKKTQQGKLSGPAGSMLGLFLLFLLAVGVTGAAELLKTDYGAGGVAFILLLYLFHTNKKMQLAVGCIASVFVLEELAAPLAFAFIAFYRGEHGGKRKLFFYLVYPLHLLLLYGVCRFLGLA